MRDVVNKNVTEEQLLETAGRVFTRGWGRMKLYFMCGLPTETDEDVLGIVETGIRTMQHGKRSARGKAVDVTVSVSTHVPKPHTPFQWCAMDALDEVDRKQRLLRQAAHGKRALKLRTHGSEASVLEGVFARGDRRLADVLERAWRNGARFDSWDERINLDVWREAFAHFAVDTAPYLGTIPVDARLPWDHISVGLEDGFLAREYRKALQSRLSPPCGKVAGTFVHHTNTADAEADARRLVCYDCGVACDMSQMREERLVFLRRLDKVREERPVIAATPHRPDAPGRAQPRKDPAHVAAASAAPAPALEPVDLAEQAGAAPVETPPPRKGTTPRPGVRYRFRFEKTGPVALLGHLDLVRALPRIFRRVEEAMVYTNGFHPKPDMSFAPALGLGVMSLDEFVDIRLHADLDEPALAALAQRMNASSPRGLRFTGAARLAHKDPAVTRVIHGARYLLAFARSALPADAEAWLAERCRAALAAETLPLRREIEGIGRTVDVRKHLVSAEVAGPDAREALLRAGLFGDLVTLDVRVTITPAGASKPSELARVLAGQGDETPPHRAVRLELFGGDAAGDRWSPLDTVRARAQAQAEAALAAALEVAALEPPAADLAPVEASAG
ncbi:MAG: TIGR03936 family radical SAM-associated protein [Polyangiaceae bacterium]